MIKEKILELLIKIIELIKPDKYSITNKLLDENSTIEYYKLKLKLMHDDMTRIDKYINTLYTGLMEKVSLDNEIVKDIEKTYFEFNDTKILVSNLIVELESRQNKLNEQIALVSQNQ